ncbi:hypothetical protein DY000_02028516 [Brassica cretica]|uniref:Growth-regulating factor n=1 Tax=Brassica cretica TaxID=69181 RepID=A0ABQ7DID8_BRACR|nr:hypothetical protein DY000_02028516 [Brassica cretica]
MNGSFLGSQEMGWNSARTLDTRVMRRPPSWQINPMNVFSQGSVSGGGGGGGINFSSPEIMDTKPESYKGIGSDSNCALSLLSNPHQPHDNNNSNSNNTWRTSSGFGPMTVTMAQPPPAPSQQHQYLNPPWVFKDDDNNCPNDMSPVLNLGRFTETEISGGTTLGEFELSDHHHHQNRRQYMESENTRAYDSSSHHNNCNSNNTWRTSSGFGPMTVTMAQPPPAPSQQHQYLNPPWVFKDDDNNCPNDMSPVLNLGRFTETEISGGTTLGEFELSDHHHHQNRRQYMESENTRAYDSSSHHNNWSL